MFLDGNPSQLLTSNTTRVRPEATARTRPSCEIPWQVTCSDMPSPSPWPATLLLPLRPANSGATSIARVADAGGQQPRYKHRLNANATPASFAATFEEEFISLTKKWRSKTLCGRPRPSAPTPTKSSRCRCRYCNSHTGSYRLLHYGRRTKTRW